MLGSTMVLAAVFCQAQQATVTPVPQNQWKEMGIKPPHVILSSAVTPLPDEIKDSPFNSRCLVSEIVNAEGLPQDIHLIHSTSPVYGKNCMDVATKAKFIPATTRQGEPIAVLYYAELIVHINRALEPITRIRYEFVTPPDVHSSEPDSDGIYPLTKVTTPPVMTHFTNEGYGEVVYTEDGSSACDVLVIISAKGKVSDPKVLHCARLTLEEPTIKSILHSTYKPGRVNKKAVPIRSLIHIEYDDNPPSQ
jgi:hypothetical protein